MNRDARRTRLLLALLVALSLTLVTLDYRAGGGGLVGKLRSAAAAVLGPPQRAVAAVVHPVGTVIGSIPHLAGYRAEADRLRRENDDLRAQLRSTGADQVRAAELDKLLGTAGRGQYRVVPARVVALGGTAEFEWTATIDVGSRDGVAPDMTVLNGDGLVGRVKTVGPVTAVVLLVVDPTSTVGARLEGSLQLGTVTGHGAGPMSLQLFDPSVKVAPGDRLVTFGSAGSRPFVPGLPIGTVRAVENTPGALTRTATVTPYPTFSALDLVGVAIEPPRTDPRDSVLPPRP